MAIFNSKIINLALFLPRWCFQERFMGQMESPSSGKVVRLIFFEKSGTTEGIRSCVLVRFEKEKEHGKLRILHTGGVDGISCRHLQVMMTDVIQKH